MTFDDFGTCLDLMNDNVFVELGILVPQKLPKLVSPCFPI